MSTIEEVRAAERKVQEIAKALRTSGSDDPNNLAAQLRDATDEYARAVRELPLASPSSVTRIDGSSWQRSA
jgi:hypothetical protein